MTDIDIQPLEPGSYGVRIVEGENITHHRVEVPEDLLDDLRIQSDPEDVVRESISFLLERTPAADIGEDISLDEVSRTHSDYAEELRLRLTP
jgi:hypothetical protein